MATIYHYFPINIAPSSVFKSISTPEGLNTWWSKNATGNPKIGEKYTLSFGPQYHWTAIVTKYVLHKEFELTITDADIDWTATKIGFRLTYENAITQVQFYHMGWKESNTHHRVSSYCWAMYLRILKRHLEFGEEVPYKDRLHV